MQLTILLISLAVMAIVAGAFIAAVRASTITREPGVHVESRRKGFIWTLLVAGVAVTVATLWSWPHDILAGEGAVAVNVTGAQWAWEIDRQTVPAGKTVIFNVQAKDVNHGMGIYDEAGTLLVQIQGMPGYVNRVSHVFEVPGTYRVLCLEYCGVAHHGMIHEFEVVADVADRG